MPGPPQPPIQLTRRAWLAIAPVVCRGLSAPADEPDETGLRAVQEQANKVGLGPFRTSQTAHYRGIGNAPETFREKALDICERLAKDYLDHFRFKGFKLNLPREPLIVVTLADAESVAAFSGEAAAVGVGGYYDRETNRLVVFDNRSQDGLDRTLAGLANLISLAHEATHQLTFNTGLLSRSGDVPLAISEGLATYAEIRKSTGSTKLGQPNLPRAQVLRQRSGVTWTPIADLISDDRLFDGEGDDASLQLIYAQSWLLVGELMRPAKPEAFHQYLDAIRDRQDTSHRLEDARTHLGDLERLDATLRRRAGWG